MQNVLEYAVSSLVHIPSSIWWALVAYTTLMVAVFFFGLPFKKKDCICVGTTIVSHIDRRTRTVDVTNRMYTEANVITALGIGGEMVMVWMVVTETYTALLPVLFIIACVVSDALDGIACSRHDCHSKFGEIIDPIRDRLAIVMIATVLITQNAGYLLFLLGAVCAVEFAIVWTAYTAHSHNILLSCVGRGQIHQAVHLLAIEMILFVNYLTEMNSTTKDGVACILLLCAFGGSVFAFAHYWKRVHFVTAGRKAVTH